MAQLANEGQQFLASDRGHVIAKRRPAKPFATPTPSPAQGFLNLSQLDLNPRKISLEGVAHRDQRFLRLIAQKVNHALGWHLAENRTIGTGRPIPAEHHSHPHLQLRQMVLTTRVSRYFANPS